MPIRTRTSRSSIHDRPISSMLHRDRSIDGRPGRLEDGEELVGAGLDLVAASVDDAVAQDRPHLVDQLPVARPRVAAPARSSPRCRSSASSRSPTGSSTGLGRSASARSDCSCPAMNPTGTILNFLAALSSRMRARSRAALVFERDLAETDERVADVRRRRGSAAAAARSNRCTRTPGREGWLAPLGRGGACADDTKGVLHARPTCEWRRLRLK